MPDRVAAAIEREGELVIVSTAEGAVSNPVKAFVRGYKAAELVNDIMQGDRELRIAPSSLTAAGLSGKPERLDKVEIDGMEATIQSCETRKLRGVPAMYVIQVRGG